MARHDKIKSPITSMALRQWLIFQLDIKSTFLNDILEKEIYVGWLEGFIKKKKGKKIISTS